MPCSDCERRRAMMKEWIAKSLEQAANWARIRDADKAPVAQANPSSGAEALPQDGGQAGNPGTEHQRQGVEAHEAAGTGEGRVSVPRVRKAGRRG